MATEEPTTFQDFKLNKQLLNAIEEAGYEQPTPIQQQAIPLITAGHDLLGIAQTGTGKTAAFLLPLLMKVKYAQGMHPRALILTPTRELAMQISEHIDLLGKYTGLRHACAYGGIGPKKQMELIEEGIDILVGTPGRILDIYRKGGIVFKEIKTMILDEADRMMDMGFMPQINSILEIIPSKKRQNLLFSATMPDKVVELSEDFLAFPMRVEVTPQATTADLVEQSLFLTPNFQTKLNILHHFMQNEEDFYRVMVFARSRKNVEAIRKYMEGKMKGIIRTLHANKGQNTRINAIEAFKDGEVRLLIATDVGARGIDVSMVSHVINFDVPVIYEDYVHRIGRTGRANNEGTAFTFCTPAETYHLNKIEEIIRMEIPRKEIPEGIQIAPTPFKEKQEMDRAIDIQKRKENPDFKGAFHEKKYVIEQKAKRFKHPKGGAKAKPKKARSGKGKKR